MIVRAVFLDRDGVLNPHIPGGYLLSVQDAVLLPGVALAIRRLNNAGVPVVLISNQQGVGKGLMTWDDLMAIDARLRALLHEEAGAFLTAAHYCTDLAGSGSLRRKPQPGMLLEASGELGIPLAQTVFAGDSRTDIQAGHAAGAGATLLLLSGGTHSYEPGQMSPAPDYIFTTLTEATDWILENSA